MNNLKLHVKKFQIDTKENLIEDIPLKDENGNFLAVIEIPKDSNEKWEISKLENNLEIDFKMYVQELLDTETIFPIMALYQELFHLDLVAMEIH